MASIIFRNGKHEIRYRDGSLNAKGKPINKSGGRFDSKAEASIEAARLDALVAERKHAGKLGRPSALMPIREILREWERDRLRRGKTSVHQIAAVVRIVQSLFDDEDLKTKWHNVSDVTKKTVQIWMDAKAKRNRASKTRAEMDPEQIEAVRIWALSHGIDRTLQLLQQVLDFARSELKQPVEQEVLDMDKPYRPKWEQKELLTDEQYFQILGFARESAKGCAQWKAEKEDCAATDFSDHVVAFMEHIATYGHRSNSVCMIKIKDFSPATGELTIRKNKNKTPFTISLLGPHVESYKRLAGNRGPEEFLFLNPYGEPWRCIADKATQYAGWYRNHVAHFLPKGQSGSYQLKRFGITAQDDAGISDRDKSAITGIKTPAIIARYKATNKLRLVENIDKIREHQEERARGSRISQRIS